MAYKPNPYGNVRDKAYPSEIAAQRPLLAPRIHCAEDPSEMDSDKLTGRHPKSEEMAAMEREDRIRMDEREPSIRGTRTDNRCAEFNRQLREGLGTGRPDNSNE
jgi:hypothetical protein